MKKVVIVNPTNYNREEKRPPFGLLTVASIFIKHGVEVIWVDADDIRNNLEVGKRIKEHLDADLIATGGMHMSYPHIKELFTYLHEERVDIPKIIGGRIASTISDILWNYVPGIDMLCKQEGEHVIDSMVDSFPNMDNILGIEYLKNEQVIINPSAPEVASLDSLPPTPWHFLSNNYFLQNTAFLLTARGCPFRCYFCRSSNDKPDMYRSMNLDQVMKDIDYMVRERNVNKIIFVDEFFVQDKKRVEEFCDLIKEFKLRWSCTSRADAFIEKDRSLLKKMKDSGCIYINMGLESGNQHMLDLMNKKLNIEKAEKSINLIREAGLNVKATFIFGYPGETRATALESINWRRRINLSGHFFYATPYPGSELYKQWMNTNGFTLDGVEKWISESASLRKFNINLTDMPDWKFKFLAAECLFRLNTLKFNIKQFIFNPLKRAVGQS